MSICLDGERYAIVNAFEWYDVYLCGIDISYVFFPRRYVFVFIKLLGGRGYAIRPEAFLDFMWHIPAPERQSIINLFEDFTFTDLVERACFNQE